MFERGSFAGGLLLDFFDCLEEKSFFHFQLLGCFLLCHTHSLRRSKVGSKTLLHYSGVGGVLRGPDFGGAGEGRAFDDNVSEVCDHIVHTVFGFF